MQLFVKEWKQKKVGDSGDRDCNDIGDHNPDLNDFKLRQKANRLFDKFLYIVTI